MNSKERFYSTINYKGYDRPPTKHYGTPEINRELMNYFGISNCKDLKINKELASFLGISSYEELYQKVGDDFRQVNPRYVGPELRSFEDGSWEGFWGERYNNVSFGNGTYPEAVYLPFKDITDVDELKIFRMPSADWFDYSHIKEDCKKYKDYVVYVGDAGTPDFMNGIARCRGVEQVLFDIATEDPVYINLMEQRFCFFHEMYKRVLQAGEGMIDVLCLGEDYGNQNGLMISPSTFEKLFAPWMKELFDLAHQYGAKTMMHCCGSCRDLIPRFIDLGLDILEVVQVDAAKMDIKELHKEFYGKISFCGSISVQTTLPFGTKEDVIKEVNLRKQLFSKGGIIIAATHDIQVGTPLENIIAMYNAIGSLHVET